uniref:Reverse transcriptase (RNA-dependent DNA polymerase) n=1 Tax=Candidatus Kentrum sp. LFY TaxID=2126342 RepID=A0A450WUE1_9GAMM|nr:MAG: Reverse transcriptase (RNA-dependent DNA polymerase) [Candidatus Kentron sp. LFY]
MRTPGISTVVDRLIQQALHQTLQPHIDPGFSESSFGFRPGRNAHQAVAIARGYMEEGYRWVVDMDSEKFFDRVDHDIVMSRLVVNRDKSAVDRPWKRKFLGYTVTRHRQPRLKVAPESVQRFKDKVREHFRRGRGRSLVRVIEELRPISKGWVAYFGRAEVKVTLEKLDFRVRRKLRAILWRQWERPRTRAEEMTKRGSSPERAWKSANNGHGPWWNAGSSHMNHAIPTRVFRKPGLPSLLETQRQMQCSLRTAVYGTVRTVVWEDDGGGNPASYPMA